MKALKPCLLSTSICAALMLWSSGVCAQSTTSNDGNPASDARESDTASTGNAANTDQVQQLQTIEVTARGVVEPLQKTPLPITAITQQTIEKKGLQNINDIAAMTPSFSFQSPFGRNLSRPVIRGMSNILGKPNASFFINGIYVEGDMSAYGLQNIKRVEVIRGPQSAQFGRRTFSGAINFITKRPGADPGGSVTLGIGNYGQRKEGAFYSFSNDDHTFGLDVSAYHKHNDGTFYNEASKKKDLGGRDSRSYMLAAYWAPTASLSFTLRSMYQKNEDQMWPIKRMGAAKLNCYLPKYTGANIAGIPILATRRTGGYCGEVSAPEHYAMNTQAFRDAGYFSGTKQKYWRNSLRVKYYFANGWQLTSTSAYNKREIYQGVDQDYSSVRGFGGAFESIVGKASHDWSENIRLASDQSKALSGVIGLYYYKQTEDPGYHGSLAGFFPPSPMQVKTIPTHPDASTTGKAVYGMLKWDINKYWTAAVEARYARDEISTAGIDVRTLGTNTYSRPYALSKTFTNFTPRYTLTWHVTDMINVYALASQGTKPGGFNLDVYRASFTDAGRDKLIARGYGSYDQSKAWNYEMGIKSDWLGGRLRVNADIYQINWNKQQLTKGAPVMQKDGSKFSTSYIANVGKSRIRGFELAAHWAFARGWFANLTYSYTDAKIERYVSQDQADLACTVPAPTLNMPCASSAGHLLPLVPKQMASLGILYTGHIGSWGYDFSFDTHYNGKAYAKVANLIVIPSSVRSNVRFNLRPTEFMDVSFYVNNVFDDDTPSGAMSYIDPTKPVFLPAVPPLTGLGFSYMNDFAVSPSLPRMYGVDVTFHF